MKAGNAQLKVAGAAVCAYAAWESRDLAPAWLHAPFDRLGFLAFLLWSVPVGLALARDDNTSPLALCAALALLLAGLVLDVNFLKHAALAIALAAFVPAAPPRRGARALWVCGAVSWLPALGWLLSSSGPAAVSGLREGIALGTTLFLCRPKR